MAHEIQFLLVAYAILDIVVSITIFMARALLGGGCFWCTEGAYKNIQGIKSALPAYAGGHDENPNYNSVCSGKSLCLADWIC